jgi:hypothetical protein
MILCKCSDPYTRHKAGEGKEPCENRACGCIEFRMDPRSRLEDKAAATGDEAA